MKTPKEYVIQYRLRQRWANDNECAEEMVSLAMADARREGEERGRRAALEEAAKRITQLRAERGIGLAAEFFAREVLALLDSAAPATIPDVYVSCTRCGYLGGPPHTCSVVVETTPAKVKP